MSEDSIFIVNVEQCLLHSRGKQLLKMFILLLFWRRKTETMKFIANATLKCIINITILQNECCKTMQIVYLWLKVYKNDFQKGSSRYYRTLV